MAAVAEARTKIAENLIIAVGFVIGELKRRDWIESNWRIRREKEKEESKQVRA